jgi:hypothetical protein
VAHLEIEPALADALTLGALANDPVILPVEYKDEVDLHLLRAHRDQLVVALQARLTPQRPCHRVQQRRFARTIFSRKTCDRDAVEIEHRQIVAVAHEVAQQQFAWDHRGLRMRAVWMSRHSSLVTLHRTYLRNSSSVIIRAGPGRRK